MMNALFVLIVFLLTLKKDYLHIKWPFGVRTNITYDETTQEVIILGSHGIFVGITFGAQVHLIGISRYQQGAMCSLMTPN